MSASNPRRLPLQLLDGNSLHPFLVVDILAGDVGGHISTDGVTVTCSSVWVELTTHVVSCDVDLGKVSPSAISVLGPFLVHVRDEGFMKFT